jgi:hypothetical protein
MKRFIRTLLLTLIVTAPLAVSAQIKLIPACATGKGDCGITDILAVFLNIAEFLLGISGAVALFFFVYGGFQFILSAGKPAGITKGKETMKNAVIGIVIIFLSGVLVRFTTQSLTGGISAIPTIGEPCSSVSQKSVKSGADGLWVSIPAGKDSAGKVIPEGLKCLKLEDAAKKGDKCLHLNAELEKRSLSLVYSCQDTGSGTYSSCVRGLCAKLPAAIACCTP